MLLSIDYFEIPKLLFSLLRPVAVLSLSGRNIHHEHGRSRYRMRPTSKLPSFTTPSSEDKDYECSSMMGLYALY